MKILVIEDEYLVAEEIRHCLLRGGFGESVHAATEGDALKSIFETGWDAAVLDGNLNGRSVDSIAEALLERRIPFVIVTGYDRRSLPERVRDMVVIEKPFRWKTLMDAVSNLVAR
jgi:CheY-like chemotaxis protein